jgi:hypothetical protein
MNLYGFTRINLGDRSRTVYCHQYFIKGNFRQLSMIQRLHNLPERNTTTQVHGLTISETKDMLLSNSDYKSDDDHEFTIRSGKHIRINQDTPLSQQLAHICREPKIFIEKSDKNLKKNKHDCLTENVHQDDGHLNELITGLKT